MTNKLLCFKNKNTFFILNLAFDQCYFCIFVMHKTNVFSDKRQYEKARQALTTEIVAVLLEARKDPEKHARGHTPAEFEKIIQERLQKYGHSEPAEDADPGKDHPIAGKRHVHRGRW